LKSCVLAGTTYNKDELTFNKLTVKHSKVKRRQHLLPNSAWTTELVVAGQKASALLSLQLKTQYLS
jgi:hypothetical protein